MLRDAREETMLYPDLETDVAALLEEAATAHSVDEAEFLSGSDDQWPSWYAAYLLAHGPRERLPQTITDDPDRLAARLTELQTAFQRDDPSGDWCRIYAQRLVAGEHERPRHDHPGQ
jgi:hypothetical protein